MLKRRSPPYDQTRKQGFRFARKTETCEIERQFPSRVRGETQILFVKKVQLANVGKNTPQAFRDSQLGCVRKMGSLENESDWKMNTLIVLCDSSHLLNHLIPWEFQKLEIRPTPDVARKTVKQGVVPARQYCWGGHDVNRVLR